MAPPNDVAPALDVSRETVERLEVYVSLLRKWNRKINLVAPGTLDDVWRRHVLDSAQLFQLAPENSEVWADLGSGGGFPGIVVAILADETGYPAVTLVEADQRKAVFLRTVLRECGIKADVSAKRIEAVAPLQADVLSARALAPLADLLFHAERHLATDGTALFPKGLNAAQEVAEARKTWSFACELMPSVTDETASILKIGDISRV